MNTKDGLLPISMLVIAGLACSLGAPARTATPDYEATITAQAQALAARTLAPSQEGEMATTAGDTMGTPPTSAAHPTPQQPSAPNATKTPKPTKTAGPASTLTSTAVPTLSVPRTPQNLAGTKSCTKGIDANGETIWKTVVTLTWEDSDTETAYRLYRNGTAYTTVILQDATSWPVYLEHPMGPNDGVAYDYIELEAYNSAGASGKAEAYVFYCKN